MILSGLGIVYVKEISLILVEIPRIHRLFSLLCTYGLNYLQKLRKWVIVLWTIWKLPWILHAWIIVFYEGLSEWRLLRHRLLFLKSCTKYCYIYLLLIFLFCICLSEHPESSSSEELLFATTRDGEITSKLGYLVYILILFYELQFWNILNFGIRTDFSWKNYMKI